MAFDVAADAYDRFMGRYSRLLAPQMAHLAGVAPGQTALDVGCGPGALTAELVRRLGAENVTAVDPSVPFVEAARRRHPGVTVLEAPAEQLPFDDDSFDAALAQLVVHFMADPVAGLSEMRRVARPRGAIAACVWDLGGGESPMSLFWEVVRAVDPSASDESGRPGAREGHLVELFEAAGIASVEQHELWVELEHATFEDWWDPITGGVGPAGTYLQRLDEAGRQEIRERCRARITGEPFVVRGRAWAARGTA